MRGEGIKTRGDQRDEGEGRGGTRGEENVL
jgi:hypothetical protein